ncbi:MAG: redoxin domain-containing protein [Deltaproteobacteria bacterium]|nr:redoxin domain-containing protein [Deltaproteobacteria bacterium]MCX7953495.1 redoxin domain-containing protein [Deltaproteobacteria bacterium]
MQITFKGTIIEVFGNQVGQGDQFPNFRVKNCSFEDGYIHDFIKGPCLIITVPSLDTPVCDREACSFSDLMVSLNVPNSVLVISKDLPFALNRWQQTKNRSNLTLLSDFPYNEAGKNLGVETSLGLLARACFVINEERRISFKHIVPELTNEPNYDEVLSELRKVQAQKA